MRWQRLVLLFVLLVCVYKALRAYSLFTLEDFRVYETAATLVREHRSVLIYNDADTGVDPQVRDADPKSLFAAEARKIGIPVVRLFVYPPILPDLLVPISYLQVRQAGWAWIALNVVALVAFCGIMLAICQVPWFSVGALAMVVGVVTFDPVLECLRLGQVVIVLLVLWSAGLLLYLKGWKRASAFALAMATAIKLTPLLVIVPIVLWREWRWLRAYLVSLAAIGVCIFAWNGKACVEDYFQHVMPAMSHGLPILTNRTVVAACQNLYVAAKGADPRFPSEVNIPSAVVSVGKALALLCVVVAASLLARVRSLQDGATRAAAWGLFALLSVVVSPVSWAHAYVLALAALVILWAEAVRIPVSRGYLVLLATTSLELSCFAITAMVRRHVHGVALSLTTAFPVALVLALVLYRLAMSRRFSEAEQRTSFSTAAVTLAA